MKKNYLSLLCCIVIAAGITSCKKDEQEPQPMNPVHEMHVKSAELYGRPASLYSSPNFIITYDLPTKLNIGYSIKEEPYDGPNDDYANSGPVGSFTDNPFDWHHNLMDKLMIGIAFEPSSNWLDYSNHVAESSLPQFYEGVKFKELSKKFNDKGYNGGYWVRGMVFTPTKQLSVICDVDYDEQHPAGTPLDDLITIKYYSAEKFIKSRYTDLAAGDSYNKTSENLAKFNTMNVNLHDQLSVYFTQPPSKAGLYKLTFIYKNADDLTLTRDITLKMN